MKCVSCEHLKYIFSFPKARSEVSCFFYNYQIRDLIQCPKPTLTNIRLPSPLLSANVGIFVNSIFETAICSRCAIFCRSCWSHLTKPWLVLLVGVFFYTSLPFFQSEPVKFTYAFFKTLLTSFKEKSRQFQAAISPTALWSIFVCVRSCLPHLHWRFQLA